MKQIGTMPKKSIIITVLLSVLAYTAANAAGLRTKMGEIRVDNLRIGQSYSLRQSNNTPFMLENTSERELQIKLEVLKPSKNELVQGFEPIPDTSWIYLAETDFVMPAESEIETDVIIEIPYEEQHRGKAYQAYLWSRTTGGSIAVGLRSKVFITIVE